MTLTWEAPSDGSVVDSYLVLRKVRDADPPAAFGMVGQVDTTTITDENVVADEAYRYQVQAVNRAHMSDPVTVDVEISQDDAGPTGLAASVAGLTVALTWDAVDGATSYNVLRQGPGEVEHSQLATSATNSYTDTAVTAGDSYSYRVQAEDGDGAGAASGAVPVDIPPPPDPPTSLGATATHELVTLTWTAPAQTITGYLVYRKVRDADPPTSSCPMAWLRATTPPTPIRWWRRTRPTPTAWFR